MVQVIESLAWTVFFVSSVLIFGVALYAFTLGIILNRRAGRRAVEAGGTSQLAASSATLRQATQTAQAKRGVRSAE